MQYLLLFYGNHTREEVQAMPEDERNALYAAWGAVNSTPGVSAGLPMDAPDTATTVRVQDGRTLTTDGPFPETKEGLGGYLVLEADDLDAAIELAARVPTARVGAVEVRPLLAR